METNLKVSSRAFIYRFFTKEVVGFFMVVVFTVVGEFGSQYITMPQVTSLLPVFLFSLFAVQLVFIFLLSAIEYSNLRYSMEQNSVSMKNGIFAIQVETIPFQKIKNASFQQSLIQRFFGVGNITIDQETEHFIWASVDSKTAATILAAVAARSNVQPIAVSAPTVPPVVA